MWIKVLLQLRELLPHLSRLLPLLQRLVDSRSTADTAAFAQLSSSVQSDIGRIGRTHDGLARKLDAQSEQLDGLRSELIKLNADHSALASRLNLLDERTASVALLARIAVGLLVLAIILLAVLLFHH